MKTNQIKCNVITCVYNEKQSCNAECIEVGCDCCKTPNTDHETLCCTFRKK